MPRILPITIALRTLQGKRLPERCRISAETAIAWLRSVSGQDFGVDAEAWAGWLRSNRWAYYQTPQVKPVFESDAGCHLVTIPLRVNRHGCPMVGIPARAKIEITVSQGRTLEDGYQEMRGVFVSGNQAGLRTLAHFLLSVSETERSGFHQHLDPDTFPNYYRSPEGYWLTIGQWESRQDRRRKRNQADTSSLEK
ncbi:MAG: hypothetical protein K1Y36_26555 [Blastocatellia bacterium]|nr:hypothetical protein [Blastocatellia bacterium]